MSAITPIFTDSNTDHFEKYYYISTRFKVKNTMLKKGISVFFLVVFMLMMTTPTILTIVDNTVDASMLLSTAGEEEGNEQQVNIQPLFSIIKFHDSSIVFTPSENNFQYLYNAYQKPHLNLISPPPELHIL